MKNHKYFRFALVVMVVFLSSSFMEAQNRKDGERMSRDRSEHQEYAEAPKQEYGETYNDSRNRARHSDNRESHHKDRSHHNERYYRERRRSGRYEVQTCPTPVRYDGYRNHRSYRSDCDYRRSGYSHGRIYSRLPNGCRRISYRGHDYFYHDGLFFSQINRRNYRVVRPIVGMRVAYLPSYYRLVYIRGYAHYQVDNVIYQKYIDPYGDPCYEVVRIL